MDLPQKVRDQIAKDLNLERTGRRGISNNIILSDGHTQDDILKINTLNLQALLDSTEEDFDTLFKDYVGLIEGLEVKEPEPSYTTITHNRANFKDKFKNKFMLTQEDVEEGLFIDGYTPTAEEVASFNIPITTTPAVPEVNLNVAPSGDTETYFGTKVKPVSYQPKTTKKKNK